MLKPRITTAAQRLYTYDDEIDDFYFMTKGIAAFIREKDENMIIGVMDPRNILQMDQKSPNLRIYQCFGCEDAVYNHMHMLIECDRGKQAEIQKNAENALNMR